MDSVNGFIHDADELTDVTDDLTNNVDEVMDDANDVMRNTDDITNIANEVMHDVNDLMESVNEVINKLPEMLNPSKSLKNEEIDRNCLKNDGCAQTLPTGWNTDSLVGCDTPCAPWKFDL